MGRPRKFSRDGVLQKAIPVFWEHGFADTSLQALEVATGVNKSGLYAEFDDKEDLFVASLRYYLDNHPAKAMLTALPLGWNNIEQLLKLVLGPAKNGANTESSESCSGCFSVSSMRDFALLPPDAHDIVAASRTLLKRHLIKNIEAEQPTMEPTEIASMILVFFSGLCMEQNLQSGRNSAARRIATFMQVLRTL